MRGARLAVHMQRDPILRELQRQRSYGARLIDVGYLKVAWLCRPIGADVQCDTLLLAIQEEGHLVLQHGEVDHEQCLNRNVQLATWSNQCEREREREREGWRSMSNVVSRCARTSCRGCPDKRIKVSLIYLMCRVDMTTSPFLINCSSSAEATVGSTEREREGER